MKMNIILVVLLLGCSVSLPVDKTSSNIRKKLNSIDGTNSIKCELCKFTVETLSLAFTMGMGKSALIKVANYACLKFKMETPRICVMAINEFSDEIWGIFANGIFVPEEICAVALGDGCVHRKKFFESWNITLPKHTRVTPTSSQIGIKTGKGPTMKILQISDTHLDNDYMQGSVALCNEPLCCRRQDGMAGKGEEAAGKYGYPGFCDTNHLMLHTMFQHMVKQHNDVDYILWTGDVPAHNVWNQTHSSMKAAIRQASKILKTYFPTKKVFPAVGNHEGVPVNSFPPPEIWSSTVPSTQWLYDELADDWGQWLPEECQATIRKGGYYTTLIQKGLRIVSLNTNFGHGDNWWLALKSDDPADQLKWLVHVLFRAEKDGEKVHVVGHVPTEELIKWWSFNYYKIVDRFRNTITAQFFGHTHHDEYRIFYDMKTFKVPINIEYLGPSVTTFHELYPGYRVYEMDGRSANSSMSIVDHHTYILDLAKVQKTGIAEFELEYSAKKIYGMKDLSPSAWDDVVNRMAKDDDLFQIFYRAFYKQHVKGKCVGQCKSNHLCVLKTAVNDIHDFCEFDEKEKVMHSIWKSETYDKC